MMNPIQISVKTSTVLVCKDLAEAQFRCMECCKAFISVRHLAKHNHKRHGFTQCFIAGLEQTNLANDDERKLTEVTGRLEKALSLLEAKTSSLESTTSHDRREDTVRENPQAINAQLNDRVLKKSPQKFIDVRRTVSLFTLPNDRACEPIFDGWMTQSSLDGRPNIEDIPSGDIQDVSGPDGEGLTKKLMLNEDTQNISIPDGPSVDPEQVPDETPDDTDPELKSIPQEIPVGANQEDDIELKNDRQADSIEPLLISLIKKLDTVFTGNRVVTNSGCQTSEPEVPESKVLLNEHAQQENTWSAPGRKSVRFSDLPMYYGSSEQHFNQSESECSSPSSGSKFEDDGAGFIENEEFQTYTNYSAQSMTRPVYHQPESAGETQIVYDPDPERTRVLESCPGQNEVDACDDSSHSPDAYEISDIKQDVRNVQNDMEMLKETEQSCTEGDESEDDCSRSRETAIPAAAAAAETTTAAAKAKIESPNNPQPLTSVETHSKVYQSIEYVATKKQILDMVEKCVQDLQESRKQSMSPVPSSPKPGQSRNREFTNSDERRKSGFPDVDPDVEIANQKLPEVRKNSSGKTNSNVVCVRNVNVTADSQGILPPCTMICKDEELDIDELSGDSYERFIKYSQNLKSEPEDDTQTVTNRPHPNLNQLCADDHHQARHQNRENPPVSSSLPKQAQSGAVSGYEMKGGRTNMKIPSKETDMKKTDYAVLLHHETSKVQSLIDMLVLDLQRWSNTRRDHLSHDIRIQLEERLASNLNRLGIQSTAKLLSDSAAAKAHLLNNQRSKSAKVSRTSYFDMLKYAFVNEVDRIAKSRANNGRNPAMQ